MKWSGNNTPLYDVLKDNWNSNILESNFSWNKAIHDGIYSVKDNFKPKLVNIDFSESIKNLIENKVEGFELCLYSKIGMGDGQQANNPWLQEFPDPISRVSWDNYLTVSKKDADEIGLKNYNVANGALDSNYALITVDGESLKVPVIIQPGQALGSVGLAFGYGKTKALKSKSFPFHSANLDILFKNF